MALVLKDRVKQTATAPGTGTITLLTTPTGFQAFSAVGNGNTTYFAIVDPTSGAWEVNYGTYTSSGTTLSRNSPPLSSSNSGSLVNFTGAVDVFLTYPSESAVWRDTAGVVAQQSFGAITATSAALTTGTVSTTPASNTDIANKQYVDGLVTQGISYHEPVYVESPNTAGNLNATYNQPGGAGDGVGATLTNAGTQVALTLDGILMTVGKRVLIYNQTSAFQNGIYTVTTVGTVSTNWVLTRSTDADTYGLRDPDALGYNDAFFVTNGDTGAGETYVVTTTGVIVFGTTNITFAQISSSQVYTAGTGLNLTPATTFNISNTGVTANTYGSASAVPVITVNAQGQATGITNTNIAINGTQVSGNISGSAGSVANALTLGTYLTGTSFNGSAAVTATVDATSANTASKVVARDSSGNFSAGTITATLSGASTSATTATNLAGGAANQIPYQTAAGTTSFITAASGTNYVLNYTGSAFSWVAGTISGVSLGSNLNALTAGTYLTSGGTYTGATARTFAVDATDANTASKVVARDASGNFSANIITASLSGNATTATTAGNVSGTVAIANGGTGQTTANTAFNALAPSQTSNTGKYLTTNGTDTSWGSISIPTQSYTRTTFTATAGQTSFTVSYTVGSLQVFLNGVFLDSTDYTATSGTAFVLSSAAASGDIVEAIAFSILNVGQVAASGVLGGTSGQALTSDGASGVWGTLGVSGGGTGATTLTGVLKGNGTGAFTAATAGTDYVAPGTATSFTALQTFSGSTSVAAAKLLNAKEAVTIAATAATGTIAYDITTQSVLYYTSNASANWTVNFRGSSGTSLNTVMATGESMTVAFLVTQGATAYYNNVVQVDGTGVTPKWQGGTAPTSGNASSVDSYVYTIVKTGNAAFTIFASQTKFA